MKDCTNKHFYTVSDVCGIAGVKDGDLRDHIESGFLTLSVRPSGESGASGFVRLSKADAIRFITSKDLHYKQNIPAYLHRHDDCFECSDRPSNEPLVLIAEKENIGVCHEDLIGFLKLLKRPPKSVTKPHISNNLNLLNDAAYEFWSSADPDDKTTHPKKEDVISWLKKNGFSEVSAKQGAVIIRPKWAALGRKKGK